MYLWDIGLKKCKREVDAHTDMIMHMLVIHDRKLMATCSMDKSIILWGLENFQKKATLNGHSHGVRKLAYSDGTLISVGFEYVASENEGRRGEYYCYAEELTRSAVIHFISSRSFFSLTLFSISSSPNNRYEAVVWDLVSKDIIFHLSGHKSGIVDVLMCPSTVEHSPLAVTLDDTGEMKIWNLGVQINGKNAALQSFNVTVR